MGWEVLAESYPDIMRKCVELAMGSPPDSDGKGGRAPNIVLLKSLLEMVPKLVGGSEEGKTQTVEILVKQLYERVSAVEKEEDATPIASA